MGPADELSCSPPSKGKGTSMSASDRKVLIVEDEALIAMNIEMQLQDLGFETRLASSVDEALRLLTSDSLDLAILDYSLRDGEKTTPIAEALHERRVPFIVCSGSQFNDMARVFEGVTVLSKPFTDDLLQSAVLGALQ